MAHLQDERSKLSRSAEAATQAPPDRAAKGAGDKLLLAVLAPAGPPQLIILGNLEQNDKLNLGSTCTSLRQASLAQFPEVAVEVQTGMTVASLAAWLERHQAQLKLNLQRPSWAYNAEWASSSIAALPAHLISALSARDGLPAAASTLTALTGLNFTGWNADCCQVPVSILRLLSGLRQLSIRNASVNGTADELLALPALKGLQALELNRCSLKAIPQALSALSQLTALKLSHQRFDVSATAPLAILQRLRTLDLKYCRLTALPQQLSALKALTRLDLSGNKLAGGWQHLVPLTQLQDLDLRYCRLTAVPERLSALKALTRLDLSGNELAGGWQHLLPMTQLRRLNLLDVPLLAEKPPPELAALPRLCVTVDQKT